MLHFFLRYQLGYEGLIGYYCKDIPLFASLCLILVYVLIPYLLGSINTAIIVSDRMYHDDIRRYGSGNAGFTNMMRTYGRKAAVLTLLGDFFKTVVSVVIGWCVFGCLTAYIAGLACFIGHIFPCFYGFKGGKGVLCMITIIFMLDWRIFLIFAVIFALTLLITKFMSLASVISAMFYPLLLNRMNDTGLHLIEFVALIIGVTVAVKHIPNLKRIYHREESKFTIKKSKKTADEEPTDAKQ